MSEKPDDKAAKKPTKPADRKIIPLNPVPNDSELLDREMEDLFDEDRVRHRQGSSEPERD